MNRAGKIDVSALPKPDPKEKAKQDNIIPFGPVETQLVSIISDILSLEPEVIGADSNIFTELGATSLSSVRIVEAFNAEFDPPISVALLFKFGTIRALANHVSSKVNGKF